MQLDVIIPTYNRQDLLRRALASLLAAEAPPGLEVQVTVVDNNSPDRTRQVVEEQEERFGGRLHYLFESRQGRSPAVNAGIAATRGELVGLIDDDEEVDSGWYARIHAAFSAGNVDFIGGPCLPRWGAECPAWFPMDYLGVVGWFNPGDQILVYGENYHGTLLGGNAVLRRAILEQAGLYSTSLGRTDRGLLSCEDEDLHRRLLAVGARGLYFPDLVIYHYVPPERLTKGYFRRWCYWHGVSRGVIDRERPMPVVYLGGIPRYLYAMAARGLLRVVGAALGRDRDPAEAFSQELNFWYTAGFFYGKHFHRATS